jgi:succinate-acetate transporter protein
MSTTGAPPDAPPASEPPKYFQPGASGVPLAVWAFGFSVIALSLANTEIVPLPANLFVPVAFGTGALGMLVGGIAEFRNGEVYGASFGVIYACFLFTTAIILRWFAPEIAVSRVAGVGGFGDSFGAYLLMWAVFTGFLTIGAYYINLPAFLAFFLLTVVYFLLGIVNITSPTSLTLTHVAGWIGLADGLCAWWVGMGVVLNSMHPKGGVIIPLVPYPYGRS